MNLFHTIRFMLFITFLIEMTINFVTADYDIHRDENAFELPHSSNDDRCLDMGSRASSVQLNFASIAGRIVTLCDVPGLPHSHKLGRGQVISQKAVRVFLGIPYAEPPIGNLRFQPPMPKKLKDGEIIAHHLKPSCPQNVKYIGYEKGINNTDEDCLYLNIYAPEMPDPVATSKYPVMVYIHGGYWDHGSANLFPGHMLATQEVIVVTFNYRLGHLGFLSTGNSASVGNYGLLDQVLALKWVYDHVSHFGGDPHLITLFGFDSGAVGASLLAISSHSRFMVKGVIAQNGSPMADWAIIVNQDFMVNTSRILGDALGCTTEDPYKLVTCLHTRTNNEYKFLDIKPRSGWLPWGPVVDNFTQLKSEILFPKSPAEIFAEGVGFQKDFSVMTGICHNEGVKILLADSNSNEQNYRFSFSTFKQKIADLDKVHNYTINSQGILDAIIFMYLPGGNQHDESLLRQSYINLLTDRYYTAPSFDFAQHLIKNGVKTYLYVCNYTFEGYQFPHSWQGVTSDSEYLLLTGAPFMNDKFFPPHLNLKKAEWTKGDRDMSHFYIKAWTDFAKYGIPTRNSFMNYIFWRPADLQNFIHLNINTTNKTASEFENYRKQESQFWSCYIPSLMRVLPTMSPTLEPGVELFRLLSGALYGCISAGILCLFISVLLCVLYARLRKFDTY